MQSAVVLRRGATGGAAVTNKSSSVAWRAMILRRRPGFSGKNADVGSHHPRQHNAFLAAVRVLSSSSSLAVNIQQQQQQYAGSKSSIPSSSPPLLLPWAAVGALALLAGVTTYTTTSSSSSSSTTMNNDHGLTAEQQHHPSSSSSNTVAGAKNIMLHRMRSTRGRSLNDKYNIDWTVRLGEGAYGSVHPARLRATGEKVALKQINRGFTNAIGFKTETDALLRIYDNGGHPNINGLRDMYEDHKYYYLILDLVSGGEMFEHLVGQGAYSEADAARLMHEVASALAFLHGVGVVHCDLKPENLLLSTKNRLDGTIKMIDFGCAIITAPSADDVATHVSGLDGATTLSSSTPTTTTQPQQRSSTGTTAYWSPERFPGPDNTKREITAAVDMWSVGVILYIMLTGVHPFDVQGVSTDKEIEQAIQDNPRPPLDRKLIGHLSDSAVHLILRLMDPDPHTRISAYEMLNHPWVQGKTALKEKITDSDKKLSRFKDIRNKLEAGVFAMLVRQSHSDLRMSQDGDYCNAGNKQRGGGDHAADGEPKSTSQDVMHRAFSAFDAHGKGFVTAEDLGRVAAELTGSDVDLEDTKEYVKATVTAENNHHRTTSSSSSAEAALSLSDFNRLFSGLQHKHFPRGHYIFNAGERGDAMYFLCSGKLEIQTRKGQLVAILRSGDFFGEGSLLQPDSKRFTSAKCSTPVDVIEIKRDDFDRYLGASAQTKHDLQRKWRARSLTYAKNLLRLQTNVKVRTFNKGEVVYREGDVGTHMYRVDDIDGGELAVSHGGNLVHKYTGGDSFGESSLIMKQPRSSTVTCTSKKCQLFEMKAEDFMAVIESSPELTTSLRDMCRKRLFKKAVKQYSLEKNRGLSDDDIVATFYEADIDESGCLNLDEVRRIMHKMDPRFPLDEIRALLNFVDVDGDGRISLEEFKRLFRQFEDEKTSDTATASATT